MLRYAALVLLVLLLALQLRLWTGPGGIRQVESLRRDVAEQKKTNEHLKQRNEALSAEVDDLKRGKQAVEERARSELGLIKPGETFYQVVAPSGAAAAKDDGGK